MSLRDARTDAVPGRLTGIVCIIGAGAAGITLARALSRTVGDVLLVEAGGLDYDADTQALYDGQLLGLPYHDLAACRLRYFGGTSNHWAGYCRSNDPINYEARAALGLEGWPLTFDELRPFVAQGAKLLGISADFFAPEALIAGRVAAPDALFADQGPDFFVSVNQIAEQIRLAERFGDEIRRSERIHLVTNLNATEVVLRDDGAAVDHVRCRTLTGRTVEVVARHVVLACHTVENARLLLNSNRQQAAGVGNGRGHVGRYFMEHPYLHASLLVASGAMPAVLEREEAYPRNLLVGLSLAPEAMRREAVLAYNCFVTRAFHETPLQDALADLSDNLLRPFSGDVLEDVRMLVADPGFVAAAVAGKAGLPGAPRLLVLEHMIEQAPDPASRVVLSTERRDALGVPQADLDWRLNELDMRTFRKGQELAVRELSARGFGRVRVEAITEELVRERVIGHFHHYGTTRMAADASGGVVDRDLRVFGIPNLSICGGSVFPTSGAHGPTLHILALALRLAGRIASEVEV